MIWVKVKVRICLKTVLSDSTNLAQLIENTSENHQIELLVNNRYVYQMRIPRSFKARFKSEEYIRNFQESFKTFSSSKKTNFFISNYTDVVEKLGQLSHSGINKYSVDQLGSFLLYQNQKQSLRDSPTLFQNTSNTGT